MVFRIADIFSVYLRHQDINDYLDYLATTYPDLVHVTTAGHTYEGRPLKCARISYTEPLLTTKLEVLSVSKKSSNLKIRSSTKSSASKQRAASAVILLQGSSHSNVHLKRSATARSSKVFTKRSSTTGQRETKSVILIDGGIHAREWISISTAIYCIFQLTENFSHYKSLLKNLDFVIVPVVNADGYEYTHTNVSKSK